MPRTKKPLGKITTVLLVAGQPTYNGLIYPKEILDKLCEDINAKPCTIEEVSPLERRANGIPACNAWPEHAMASSTGASVIDGKLTVDFDVKNNKYGSMLMKSIQAGEVEYIPVGIGDYDKDNVVTKYNISYITMELKYNGNG